MNAIIMTKSVIGQATNKEIDPAVLINQTAGMSMVPSLLPDDAREAMSPKAIGERLRILRLSQKLSPSQISDMLGIERTYWSRFENGHRSVTDPVAALLVLRFGVTLDFLVLGRWDKLPFDLAEDMRAVLRSEATVSEKSSSPEK